MLVSVRKPLKYTHWVPNIIFRTTESRMVNSHMFRHCHEKWLELNPGYTMVWYSSKDCDRFMKKYFIGKVYNAYYKLKPGAYKADLWRLCILYKYGGIYIDSYAVPYVSIDTMLRGCWNKDSSNQFISVLDEKISRSGIHNGFIVATRKHPFLKQGIEDIVYNVENKVYGNSSLDVTGPICLLKAINKVLGKPLSTRYKQGRNPGFYLFELYYGPYQNVYKKDLKILSKKYSFLSYIYAKVLCKTDYARMWQNKDIYKLSNE